MTIEERLEELERRWVTARRINFWLVAAMVSTIAGVLLALIITLTKPTPPVPAVGTVPKTIRANEFVLEDAAGATQAVLSTDNRGTRLRLSSGKRNITLSANNAGTWLDLSDGNGKKIITLSASDDLADISVSRGKSCISLSAAEDAGAYFSIVNENGKRVVSLDGKTFGAITLCDENEKLRTMLDAGPSGAGLTFWDENGNLRAQMSQGKDGPALELLDEKGKVRTVMGTTKTESPDGKTITYPESSLILFGPDGKVVWVAPR